MSYKQVLDEIVKITGDMWTRGWIEANGGNISIRLDSEQIQGLDLGIESPWIDLPTNLPQLGEEVFLVTGTGKFLRNVALDPLTNAGFIQLNNDGTAYRIIHGFNDGGRPTSEIAAHLGTHNILKTTPGNNARVVMHAHAVNLISLTYTINLNSNQLSKLLWQMQTESLVIFPRGVELLEWMTPGSNELGEATAKALSKRPIAIWKYHGVLATGKNLDEAFGRIHVAEKAAEIYLKTKAAGGPVGWIANDQFVKLAKRWNCDYDPEILNTEVTL